jgi:hypothetical protein
MLTLRLRRLTVKIDRPAATAEAKRVTSRVVLNTTRKINNQATINCPVDTGNLRAHHRMRTSETQTKLKGEVFNDANYAASIHNGSRAHVIAARRRKALAFDGGDWGGIVVVRSVRHPGTRPQPWLAKAAEQVAAAEGHRWVST